MAYHCNHKPANMSEYCQHIYMGTISHSFTKPEQTERQSEYHKLQFPSRPMLEIRDSCLSSVDDEIWLRQSKAVSHITHCRILSHGFKNKSHSLGPEISRHQSLYPCSEELGNLKWNIHFVIWVQILSYLSGKCHKEVNLFWLSLSVFSASTTQQLAPCSPLSWKHRYS